MSITNQSTHAKQFEERLDALTKAIASGPKQNLNADAPSVAEVVRNACAQIKEKKVPSRIEVPSDEILNALQGALDGVNKVQRPDVNQIKADQWEKILKTKAYSPTSSDSFVSEFVNAKTRKWNAEKKLKASLDENGKLAWHIGSKELKIGFSHSERLEKLHQKLAVSTTQVRNNEENHTIKIIHVTQMHALPFGIKPLPEVAESIVNSQIKVANYIKSHPESLVFLEGLVENQSGIPNDPMTFVVAKVLFPKGLPEDVAKLNSIQKEYLSDKSGEGSVRTLNRLGELKSMYRTISPKESEIISSKIVNAKSFQEALIHMRKPRERAAMESIKEVLKENPHVKEALLVFGGDHDFSQYCLEYGFEHEKVNCH